MKKILILATAVLFIAGACTQQTAVTPTPIPNPPTAQTPPPVVSGSKVDAAVKALNVSVDSEDAINLQTDDDLINSDKTIINSFDGVSNVSF